MILMGGQYLRRTMRWRGSSISHVIIIYIWHAHTIARSAVSDSEFEFGGE
jgi:hypothetical protein